MKKYAAFISESRHIPGDERSRTNPGHGYPAHTINYTTVREFCSEQEMLLWVKQQDGFNSKNYRIVTFEEVTLKRTVTVKIEEDE